MPDPTIALPITISPYLTLQTPLSRRGIGPGLILIAEENAPLGFSDRLDPPPLQKWAEEGFAVVQLLVKDGVVDGMKMGIERAVEVLRHCEQCSVGVGVGVVSYLLQPSDYLEQAVLDDHVKTIVHHCISTVSVPDLNIPQLIHCAGADNPLSAVEQDERKADIKVHNYPTAPTDSHWILPASEKYHSTSAELAHTRSLEFLKPLLDGPYFDIEAVWEEHTKFEFAERDVDKTMATMVAQPYVNHIPTMTGGIGQTRLRAFYTSHFIFSNPPSTSLTLLSRSISTNRVIDEFLFTTIHTTPIPWLLPAIPPTNLPLSIPMTSIVTLRGDRLCHEHIHWDQGTALMQLGLLPEWLKFPFSIDGGVAKEGKRFEVRTPCVGVEGSRKAVDEGYEESNTLIQRGVGGGAWREVDDV